MRRLRWVSFVGLLSAFACGGSGSGGAGSGGAAGASGTGAMGGAGGTGGAGGSGGTGGATGGSGGTGATGGATGGSGGATGGSGGATGGSGGATGGSGGATGGSGGATGGSGGATGGSGGATGGTGGATGGAGGTGGSPTSGSFRLAAKDRVLSAAVATASDGLLMTASSTTSNKPTVIQLDSTGKLEWAQTYSAGTGFYYFGLTAAARRPSGGYAFAGWGHPSSGPGVVMTTTATGQIEWSKGYSALGTLESVAPTSDGGYLVHGENGGNATLARLDAQGSVQWATTFTPAASSGFFDAVPTTDGGFALIGAAKTSGALVLAKVDNLGKVVFSKSVSTGAIESYNGSGFALTGGGFVAALLSGTATQSTTLIVVVDATGNVVASHHYTGLGYPTAIVAHPQGGLLMAGEQGDFPAGQWWAKCDATGTLTDVRVMPETAFGFMNQPRAVATKSDGSLLLATMRTDNSDWYAVVDTVSPSGSTCIASQALAVTKTAVATTAANAGSFTTLAASATAFTLTATTASPAFTLACGS